MGTITKKNAKVGTTKVDFNGKIGSRTVSKGNYRVVATATAGAAALRLEDPDLHGRQALDNHRSPRAGVPRGAPARRSFSSGS